MEHGLAVLPWTLKQCLQFTAKQPTAKPYQSMSFTVLAGPGGPVITDGWPQVSNIARPRRKAFTQVTGYDPVAMDVPVRFYDGPDSPYTGWPIPGKRNGTTWWQTVEDQIQALLWMAGRGTLYASGTEAQGDPPIVRVSADNSSNLIPPDLRGIKKWIITNLQFDPNPIRDRDGNRWSQDVTVSLVQFVGAPGDNAATPSSSQDARGANPMVETYRSTKALDTIQKICQAHAVRSWADIQAVVLWNTPFLKIRSVHQKLKVGTKVQIPTTLLNNKHYKWDWLD